MAFKRLLPTRQVPDSPEKLFLELPRRRIPDVLPHQKEIMRLYAAEGSDLPDVALQLPTGSGKTLVGLLIAEWRRRRNRERIVYLCPTRQLVNQVVEQAEDKYGLTILAFTGSSQSYDSTAKAEYQTANRIAVTTCSSLFNTNPYFDDADVVIVDDAHAAESYISDLWSVRVERNSSKHATAHAALAGILKSLLEPFNYARMRGQVHNIADRAWVDKLPTPKFHEVADEVIEVLDTHTSKTNLAYPWSMIREHLHACHMFISCDEILIRPLIPPTSTHSAFCTPKQRIYMSATLGAGGDLERLMGRRRIHRLPTPEGWDRQGVGRRFFVFPGMSIEDKTAEELRRELMQQTPRSIVLVPSTQARDQIVIEIEKNLAYKIFGADDIEESKKPFISKSKAVAVVANRYDGIDFPGNECRLLFIEGLPKATNLQERFLMARMGANVLFNERIQTRVLQAIGRCTRSLEDFSAVIVSGEELTDYLADIRRRKYLHPELQAEIEFGVEQSKGITQRNIVENFNVFQENGEEWELVNQQIVDFRKQAIQDSFPAMNELCAVAGFEVGYQQRLWQGDYESALDDAESVLGCLTASELRGYRALWHYLAGSVARLGANAGVAGLTAKSRAQYRKAKEAATGIPWLVSLARYQADDAVSLEENAITMQQIERVESILVDLGTVHDRKFARREKEILDGLQSKDSVVFESAHKLLGDLLGFEAGNSEEEGAPDPWWISGNTCFVFEDHSGAEGSSSLSVRKARQVASHPNWIRKKMQMGSEKEIIPVLISPVKKVDRGATPHLDGVVFWELSEFRAWAGKAVAVVRSLRRTFSEAGDLAWRPDAAEQFELHSLDALSLNTMLRKKPAGDIIVSR